MMAEDAVAACEEETPDMYEEEAIPAPIMLIPGIVEAAAQVCIKRLRRCTRLLKEG
jgi:hypothetical protein